MKRLCTILARGGSKGVKNKNILPLAGRPLIAHTIEQARECDRFDVIAVSSDDEAILEIARQSGVDFLVRRPPDLASDTAQKVPAIRHCMLAAEKKKGVTFDTIVDLAVTSPLRSVADITAAVAKLEDTGVPNVISVNKSANSPYFNILEQNSTGQIHICKPLDPPIMRRQDAPETFEANGAVYVWSRKTLLSCEGRVLLEGTALFVMPEEHSIDIDTALDFRLVELMMQDRAS